MTANPWVTLDNWVMGHFRRCSDAVVEIGSKGISYYIAVAMFCHTVVWALFSFWEHCPIFPRLLLLIGSECSLLTVSPQKNHQIINQILPSVKYFFSGQKQVYFRREVAKECFPFLLQTIGYERKGSSVP